MEAWSIFLNFTLKEFHLKTHPFPVYHSLLISSQGVLDSIPADTGWKMHTGLATSLYLKKQNKKQSVFGFATLKRQLATTLVGKNIESKCLMKIEPLWRHVLPKCLCRGQPTSGSFKQRGSPIHAWKDVGDLIPSWVPAAPLWCC